jgi:Spy/CpxP family protein refolding chaperone
MSITFVDAPVQQSGRVSPVSGLTSAQLATVCATVREELGEISVQFRHATPFSATRQQLREELAELRAVLVQEDVASANAAAVAEVLTERVVRLQGQRRRCDNPRFARELVAEQAMLGAIVDQLRTRVGA